MFAEFGGCDHRTVFDKQHGVHIKRGVVFQVGQEVGNHARRYARFFGERAGKRRRYRFVGKQRFFGSPFYDGFGRFAAFKKAGEKVE